MDQSSNLLPPKRILRVIIEETSFSLPTNSLSPGPWKQEKKLPLSSQDEQRIQILQLKLFVLLILCTYVKDKKEKQKPDLHFISGNKLNIECL